MSTQHVLAEAVRQSGALLRRYLRDFDDTNHTRQAPSLPNHVAWNLGHLALTMHRAAEKLDGRPLPGADFVEGGAGDAARFGSESVAFGSTPRDDPAVYPAMARCAAIFDAAIERLAGAVEQASDAQLAATTRWGAADTTIGALIPRMVFHNGTHNGQIADLRRALGLGSVFR